MVSGRSEGQPLIRLRPRADTIYISQDRTVFATDLDGGLSGRPYTGLFVHETRLLSRYRYLIDAKKPLPVALSKVQQHTWLGYFIQAPPGRSPDEAEGDELTQASQQTLELRVSRYVGASVHEDVDLTNFTQESTAFQLALQLDADFADLEETSGKRQQTGQITRDWRRIEPGRWELVFDYRAEHHFDHQGNRGVATLRRSLAVQVKKSGSEPIWEDGRLEFPVRLGPHESWHACMDFIPTIDGRAMPAMYGCRSFDADTEYDRRRRVFLNEATRFVTPGATDLSAVVSDVLETARRDLAALRLHDLGDGEDAWTLAAGLPSYVALFGRDTLSGAWQSALLGPEIMRGTLTEIPRWQGKVENDWRDEQPGRMLHEAHTGPLAALNYNPRSRYYGSATTSSYYPFLVSVLWHWAGDKELIRPFVEPALKALEWKDRYCDPDGDGFYEYQTRSEQGTANQGWKDSGDAIVYEDGSQAKAPIEVCEEQAYVYLAKLFMSEVLWALDEKAMAKRFYHEAGELKKRFNDTFWMPEEGFFAMGRDAQNRLIRSIGSNQGHAIGTGIADDSLVEETSRRLLADDLFTGWGIRTLSSKHPAYNPYSYHRGSVWPVEQGAFALGFLRYGLHAHAETICRAQFEAAALFDFYRLPEVFSGHPRDADHPFPAFYPKSDSPQAWSASAVFCFVQSMLGIYPYAPLHILIVDPHLPEWLPEITVNHLRVGRASADIRFYREKDGQSDYEVADKRGELHVLRQPSLWSLTSGFGERLIDALASLLPGK